MPTRIVHTCVRVRDIDASVSFYRALGFEERGRLNFDSAYNVYLGLPGDDDRLELTVNVGREEPYDLGDGYNHVAVTVEDIDVALARLAELGVEPPYRIGERAVPASPRSPSGRARRPAPDRLRGRPRWVSSRGHRRRRLLHTQGRAAPGGMTDVMPEPTERAGVVWPHA